MQKGWKRSFRGIDTAVWYAFKSIGVRIEYKLKIRVVEGQKRRWAC
jgi:hypothetical protein